MRRFRAFTLVELLIVVGIIAILMSILLPAIGKIRETGKQVACMSNLRQLGAAMMSYAADNDNALPATARNVVDPSGTYPTNDWLFWQQNRVPNYGMQQLQHSAIAKYVPLVYPYTSQDFTQSSPTLAILRCPSDEFQSRTVASSASPSGPYPFSYVMNWFIAGESNLTRTSSNGYQGTPPALCTTLLKVLNPSQKVLMYEEDQSSLDDGDGQPWMGGTFDPNSPTNNNGAAGGIALLSIRHEWRKAQPGMQTLSTAALPVPSPDARGNVVFCDGHAEFVSRAFVHRPDHTIGSQF